MEIISHRGFWSEDRPKNSFKAFNAALRGNFGIETDVRDHMSKIVISHDMPNDECMTLEDFLDNYISKSFSNGTPRPCIALNIKADGLADEVCNLVRQYNLENYFVFDMSIPDTMNYIKLKMNVCTRISEYERARLGDFDVYGAWVDQFEGEWFNLSDLKDLLNYFDRLCIVSPELHNRDHMSCWGMLREFEYADRLSLCTDYPILAREFFK